MGLNDSYANIRGQVLLMEPIPPITKVLSLISQEEQHRAMGIDTNRAEGIGTMAMIAKEDLMTKKTQKKDRPYCTKGLYVLDKEAAVPHQNYVNQVTARVWHNRLGHPSNAKLNILREVLHFHSVNNSSPCCICPLAKQRRLSFPLSKNMSDSVLDLIHCDIWGPFHTVSHCNNRYFFTLVDDHSRYTWVFLLKQKSDVHSIIPKFCKMVENQLSTTIKCFRSDNAKELVFYEFFWSKRHCSSVFLR